jgi:hypothetical protein
VTHFCRHAANEADFFQISQSSSNLERAMGAQN